jgi:hypothetical protein
MCVRMRLSSQEANRPAPQETRHFAFYIRQALVEFGVCSRLAIVEAILI